MKKIVVIILCLIVVITASTVGFLVVSANTQIKTEENIIDIQNSLQQDFKSYGYTIDNPNIIINPYEISPLSALIIFETEKEQSVKIEVEGKDDKSIITNTFDESKIHYIEVYGLYPDKDNKVLITSNGTTNEYIIKTSPLPEDLVNTYSNTTNKFMFITTEKYTYAIDSNNDIRWYLTNNYSKEISMLDNGNLLLSTNKQTEDNYNTGLVEIDLLGKIYKEYKINTGYYGSYAVLDNSILALSNNVLEIDKQTGTIINEYELNSNFKTLEYDNGLIILSNDKEKIGIDYNTKEQINIENIEITEENTKYLDLYQDSNNYQLETGVSFDTNTKTKEADKHIILINYKKTDDNYKKYNIKFIQESDRLVISGNFKEEDEVYIILDKFLDKKIYNIDTKNNKSYNYINNAGLLGKYSIYIKINNKLYKTNKYVKV